jgi:predicted DNA-binding transcriptional regulator YafY
VGERMGAAKGTLLLLRFLAEGPKTQGEILGALHDAGSPRNERTLRRWLEALRAAGFDVRREDGRYELVESPVRLAFSGYEALAALSVLESLAIREPVYGTHLDSAAAKLREAIPEESLRFADSGKIEFALDFASDPPEDPNVMDTLRRATRQSRRVEILYHSLSSETVRRRLVEPVRLSYAQSAHRLYAYEREEGRVTEFRINRIREAKMLPDKFSPEAHRRHLDEVRVRLSEKAFVALGKIVVPDDAATIELLDDGGAVVSGTTPTVFWTVRELAALGPEAEVLGGPKLKREFLSFLEETSATYSL